MDALNAAKFVCKGVVVEAVRIPPESSLLKRQEFVDLLEFGDGQVKGNFFSSDPFKMADRDTDGNVIFCNRGDWLIKENGQVSPCPNKDFQENYQAIEA